MTTRPLILLATVWLVAACAGGNEAATKSHLSRDMLAMYDGVQDGEVWIPPVPREYLNSQNVRREVDYWSDEPAGTIVVDPYANYLYLVLGDNRAMRYSVAVGADGRGFAGEGVIPYGREWPSWRPTANMVRRDPDTYGPVADGLPGGEDNPLGARALYLYRGGKDTHYRIHGTPYPWSVGRATSAGCIRLFQQDIIDLYDRIDRSGTHVVVLPEGKSGEGTVPPGETPFDPSADVVTADLVPALAPVPPAGLRSR